MSERALSRCLRLSEVQLRICEILYEETEKPLRSILHLALMCKGTSEVAMRIIWENVPDLGFLLRLLPHDDLPQECSLLLSEFDGCEELEWCHLASFYEQRPGIRQSWSRVCWSISICLDCH